MGAASIQSALDILSDSDKQPFLDKVEKWDCWLSKGMNDQMFGLITYSSIHCKMDCKVLMDGYSVFKSWVLEHTGLDVDNYNTIQSLASSFMLKSGCYENVFQTNGVLQQFLSRCVVGGRVMTNSNEMYYVSKTNAGFDACSLYPGAMFFMKGFLKGLQKVLTNTSYDFLKRQDVYFIRIEIIQLRKHLDFPLTFKIKEDE